MKFLLDTNVVIAIMKGSPAVLSRIRQHHPSDFGLPSVVLHELYFGAYKSKRAAENLERVAQLRFDVLALDPEDARVAGEVRAVLEVNGQPIGAYDVLIAGQAIARGLTLITRNTREFVRVPNLSVENWED
ncbi:type II toxin-antitoxin system VapC family toxin [Rhizobium sp. RU36D]|uniref:type II toxin-antitoxin system VapC family toxin n=1 Tax=Rhizobium sp. RU36D TaxID=1907415 RepID=UPI0009D8AFC6|nr:type II toxin-antitoxin system VapC family toxin [Rhizobium sp. RU36D]SMC46733.1 tRNA(fMet)-specific endonuclease VapC [Rhizobium sp. RU36D]